VPAGNQASSQSVELTNLLTTGLLSSFFHQKHRISLMKLNFMIPSAFCWKWIYRVPRHHIFHFVFAPALFFSRVCYIQFLLVFFDVKIYVYFNVDVKIGITAAKWQCTVLWMLLYSHLLSYFIFISLVPVLSFLPNIVFVAASTTILPTAVCSVILWSVQ